MKTLRLTLPMLAGAALLAGCASSFSPEEYAEEQVETQKILAEANELRKARESERIAERIEDIPEWVIEPPANGAMGVYAVGSASSNAPALALRKARLKSEFALAQAIRQEISSQERQYQAETISGQVSGEYELLVDRFVRAVPLKGHTLVDQVVYASDGKARAHVLYRMSAEALREALARESDALQQMASVTLFEALEQRVKEATAAVERPTTERVNSGSGEAADAQQAAEGGVQSATRDAPTVGETNQD